MELTRQQALDLLMKYNKEPFHILHGLRQSAGLPGQVNRMLQYPPHENRQSNLLCQALPRLQTLKEL